MRLPITATLLISGGLLVAACDQNERTGPESAGPSTDAATATASSTGEAIPAGRLPQDVKPLAYDIDFTMDPDQPAFSAQETIRIELTVPRDTIWLHGRDIEVSRAQLALADGTTQDVQYQQVNDAGVVRLALPKTVAPQEARILLTYTNPWSPGLLGAYKTRAGGENYIFTQFEAIAARRAFPGFDEPAFKTPFSYSFTVPEGDKVVANTPVEKKSDAGNGMVKWQFVTTRPLPTYLVAWAIGPLDIVEGPPIPANDLRDRPVPLFGVTVKGKGEQIRYALEHAGEMVRAEEQYFGIAYPWRKLSLIAVPDFGAGAMENVGAITFRERLLLMDADTAPTEQKRLYWSVTAHELGHMWTGDLVTVPWWNDIWLNEAFATWTEQKTLATLHPEWHPEMDTLDSLQYAMHADSLVSARAIRQPIAGTGDIRNAFDAITYQKGAAVIRMFENYVGPTKFREGMHNYLVLHSYESADLEGFLAAISKAAGNDVGSAFESFLNQPGLPLVEATLDNDGGRPVVHLVQTRYLPLGSGGDATAALWQIPVCMRYPVDGQASQQCYLLTRRKADVPLKSESMPAWFMPNAMGTGYYQWSPGEAGYGGLTASLERLTPVERMSLAGSIEAAFRAGSIDIAEAMKALAPFAQSDYEALAEEPMTPLEFAHEWLVDREARDGVEAYAQKLYGHFDVAGDFAQGGAPEDARRRKFEASVAGFLARTGQDRAVQEAAATAGIRWLGSDGSSKPDLAAVTADFVPVALRAAVRRNGKPVFDRLERVFRAAETPFVRNAALDAMAGATDPALARRVRAMTLEPGLFRQNEITTIVFSQFNQSETRDATWSWFQENYDQLVNVLPAQYVSRLPIVARYFCSDAKAAEIKTFFEDRLEGHPGSERRLAQSLETAHLCAALRKAQTASAQAFFAR